MLDQISQYKKGTQNWIDYYYMKGNICEIDRHYEKGNILTVIIRKETDWKALWQWKQIDSHYKKETEWQSLWERKHIDSHYKKGNILTVIMRKETYWQSLWERKQIDSDYMKGLHCCIESYWICHDTLFLLSSSNSFCKLILDQRTITLSSLQSPSH